MFLFFSSFSAGCRGGLFMCAINSFTRRVKLNLFGSLVRQDIGFFETIKTGKANTIAVAILDALQAMHFMFGWQSTLQVILGLDYPQTLL